MKKPSVIMGFNDDDSYEFNPKINNPMIQDLCRKACSDVYNALDLTMQIVPDDDRELEGLIKNSILASVATNCVGIFVDFMYASHINPGSDTDELTPEQFQDVLAKLLAKTGRVLIQGHIQRRAAKTIRKN